MNGICDVLTISQILHRYHKDVWTCATQIFLFGARRYEKPSTDPSDLEIFFLVAHVQTSLYLLQGMSGQGLTWIRMSFP